MTMMNSAQREARIRELRWQLFNVRQAVEDDLGIAKQSEAQGDGAKAASAHQGRAYTSAKEKELAAELARLEREAEALLAGGGACQALLLKKAEKARKEAGFARALAAAELAKADEAECQAQELERQAEAVSRTGGTP